MEQRFEIKKAGQKLGLAFIKKNRIQLIAVYNPQVEGNPVRLHKKELFNCLEYLRDEPMAMSVNSVSGFEISRDNLC